MDYTILEADDPDKLAYLVNHNLIEGWRCQGGVAMLRYEVVDRDGWRQDYYWYAQAMVRDRSEKAE